MRKLIMASSLAIITVFAVLLANADETQESGSTQQPGITESADANLQPESREQPRTKGGMKADHWKTAKICTDENGVVHKRGQKGFNTCVEHMRRKEEQMGGTIAPKASPKAPGSESMEHERREGESTSR
jgi:hypothetical protein